MSPYPQGALNKYLKELIEIQVPLKDYLPLLIVTHYDSEELFNAVRTVEGHEYLPYNILEFNENDWSTIENFVCDSNVLIFHIDLIPIYVV